MVGVALSKGLAGGEINRYNGFDQFISTTIGENPVTYYHYGRSAGHWWRETH